MEIDRNREAREYNVSSDISERIDILKVWLAILVVFMHNNDVFIDNTFTESMSFDFQNWYETAQYVFSDVLARCAVPGFFFFSAFFLYRKPFDFMANVKRKLISLMVPYFLLISFWILFFIVARFIPYINTFFTSPENNVLEWDLKKWLWAYFGASYNICPFLYPLWFIRDLFVLNVIAKIYEFVVDRLGWIAFIGFVAMWLFLPSTHLFFLNIQGACFWGMGCCFARKKGSLEKLDKINKPVLGIVSIVLIVVSCVLRSGPSNYVRPVRQISIPILLLAIYLLLTHLKGRFKGFILRVSVYSFFIYLFHEMTLSILKKAFVRYIPSNIPYALFAYFLLPFLIAAYSVLIGMFFEKYIPPLYRVLSGGRKKHDSAGKTQGLSNGG